MKKPDPTDGTDWRELAQSMTTAFRQFVEMVTVADPAFCAEALRRTRFMVAGTLADKGIGERERRAVTQFFEQTLQEVEARSRKQ